MPGTIPLGSICTSTWECANGASCYAVSSSSSTLCGNFGAVCSYDSQCAFNSCVSGSCSGTTSSSSLSTAVTTSVPSSVATSLPLGAVCTTTSQCTNGVECYASSSMEIPHCGNFGATCSSDAQCAFNSCVSGSCQGTLSTLSTTTSTPQSTGSASRSTTSTTTGAKVTTTGALTGFSTSITVANGVTSSVLVNSAGATTSFGASATGTTTTTKSGAGRVVAGGGMLVLVGGVAMWLF
jgi:hypothetical protein